MLLFSKWPDFFCSVEEWLNRVDGVWTVSISAASLDAQRFLIHTFCKEKLKHVHFSFTQNHLFWEKKMRQRDFVWLKERKKRRIFNVSERILVYLANFSDPKVQQKQVRPDTSRYVPNWCKNRPNALVYTTYLLWFGRWFLRLIIIFCFAWVLQVGDLISAKKKRELLHTDAKEKAVDKNKTSRRPRCFFPQTFVLAYFFPKWAYGIRLK